MEEEKTPAIGTLEVKEQEEDYVKAWLQEHPQFVETWLQEHPQVSKVTKKYELTEHSMMVQASPVASILQPPSSTIATQVPILSDSPNTQSPSIPHRKSAHELLSLSKQDMFMELLRDVVSPNFDVNSISHKILVNVLLLTNADRSSLFLMEGCSKKPILVSRLFDVTENSSVESALHDEKEAIKIPMGVGIVGSVASTGVKINLTDAYKVSCMRRAFVYHYVQHSYITSTTTIILAAR